MSCDISHLRKVPQVGEKSGGRGNSNAHFAPSLCRSVTDWLKADVAFVEITSGSTGTKKGGASRGQVGKKEDT